MYRNQKKWIHVLLCLALLIGLLGVMPTGVTAAGPFEDDFEGMSSYTIPSASPGNGRGWQSNTGTNNPWSITTDGSNYVMKATNTNPGSTFTLYNNNAMSSGDMMHSSKMKVSNTAIRTGITVRYLDGSNYYALTLNGGNMLEIRKKTSTATTTVASAPFVYDTSNFYTLTLSTVTIGSEVMITGSVAGGPTLVFTDATPPNLGTKFGFYVAGVSGQSQTAYYDEVYVTDAFIPVPQNVTAIPGDGKVTLNWSATTGAASYTVKRWMACTSGCATGQLGYYETLASQLSSTSYVHQGIANGTTYQYVVSAIAGHADGLLSQTVSATPQDEATSPVTLTSVVLSGFSSPMTVGAASHSVVTAVYSDQSSTQVTSGVTYNSSNNAVATVSPSGVVTAVASGQTVLTAVYGGVASAGVELTVNSSEGNTLSSITLGAVNPLLVGGTDSVQVYGTYSNNEVLLLSTGLSYSSSQISVATVSSEGVITAVGEGTTVIQAVYSGVPAATVQVTVRAVTGLTLYTLNAMSVSETQAASVLAVLNDNTTQPVSSEVSYTSSNPSVATVSSDGIITALKLGVTQIQASYGSVVSAVQQLSVNKIAPSDDTYVASSVSSSPQGSATTMKVKLNSNVEFRNSYAKFNIPALDGTLDTANLRLNFSLDSNTTSYVIELQGISDDNWSEQTLMYNQQPGTLSGVYANDPSEKGTVIGQYTIDQPGVYNFDVTDFVKNQLDGIISFRMIGVTNGKGSSIATKENTDASIRPALIVSTKPDLGEPKAPLSLQGAAQPGTSVILEWTAADDRADGYSIYRGTENGGPYVKVGRSTTTGFTDQGLAPGTTYYYIATAFNDKGESHGSTQTSVVTYPSVPVSLVATPGDRQITLSWQSVDGANAYHVYQLIDSQMVRIGTGISLTQFTHTGLQNGAAYTYVITATNASGEGDASSSVTASPVVPLIIGTPSIKDANRSSVNILRSNGFVDISLPIQNSSAVSVTGQVVVGLYRSNGEAVSEARLNTTFLSSNQAVDVHASFDLPADVSGLTVRAVVKDASDINQLLSNIVNIP
ncbi:DUF7594 domain-containing protein [Paenibacillus ferrarius]|uniref:CBM96 family carbohydrate-binding protein n=1 Tax=Paenibacillus ferrarius TaxID=1469647 RepID=UPI003D281F0B